MIQKKYCTIVLASSILFYTIPTRSAEMLDDESFLRPILAITATILVVAIPVIHMLRPPSYAENTNTTPSLPAVNQNNASMKQNDKLLQQDYIKIN